jgi:hypothetical protein
MTEPIRQALSGGHVVGSKGVENSMHLKGRPVLNTLPAAEGITMRISGTGICQSPRGCPYGRSFAFLSHGAMVSQAINKEGDMEPLADTVVKFKKLAEYDRIRSEMWKCFSDNIIKIQIGIQKRFANFTATAFNDKDMTMTFDPVPQAGMPLYCRLGLVLDDLDWIGYLSYGYIDSKNGKKDYVRVQKWFMLDTANMVFIKLKGADGRNLSLKKMDDVAEFHYQILHEVLLVALSTIEPGLPASSSIARNAV